MAGRNDTVIFFLASDDSRRGNARRGDIGDVVDVAAADNLVFVDFGGGAIACSPDEIAVVTESPRSRFRVN